MSTKASTSNLEDLLLLLRRNIAENIRCAGFHEELTFSEGEVLRFIGSDGPKTMKEVASYLKIAAPSLTEVIDELERKKLILRRKDKVDRRVVYINLSRKAQRLRTSFIAEKREIFKKMFTKLNNEEKKALKKIINKLIKE